MKSNIKFNWRTNKACFPANSATLAYVLLEAVPLSEKQIVRQPLNLSLVLDRSGSMKGTKIENVRKAVNAIIEQLTDQDILSVILFNEEVELLIPAQSVSNKAELKKKIDQITHGGGTMISKGFRIGLDELQSFWSEDRINRMILLTDGQTYGDEDQCCQLAQEAARQNIAVTALGVGDEWYEDMIDAIAQYSSGKSDYIAQPEEILSFFNEEVETFRDTVFQNATLTLRLSEGVVPKRVFRVTPMISNLGFAPISEHDIILNLKELTTNVGQRILVELMLPARPEGDFRLAQAELCYDIPQEGVLDEKIR
ncbi:VWA domain-containing protein, partial [candidate division KSB1 bacterium]|nr:VWA domain-containing protein [candidate division KSB1 bacterium]